MHNKKALHLHLLQQPLFLGDLKIRNRVFLAPMSGVTDLPFRRLAWAAGAGLVTSEMVASEELCKGRDESLLRLEGQGLGVHVVQLAGREPRWMAEAARLAESAGADIIDINMGCPAKKVIGGYSGAALMRDVPIALAMIEAVVDAVTIPVTLKMRLGWDENLMNAPHLAHEAQKRGIRMITIHGRTRMQFYNGRANWDAIRQVRDVIDVPLVANGDVTSRQDAQELLQRSGADCIMVGRASYGQPWLCGVIAGEAAPVDIPAYIADHYHAMLRHYGIAIGVRHARKHLDWYLQKHAHGYYTAEERAALLTATNPDEALEYLNKIFLLKSEIA